MTEKRHTQSHATHPADWIQNGRKSMIEKTHTHFNDKHPADWLLNGRKSMREKRHTHTLTTNTLLTGS